MLPRRKVRGTAGAAFLLLLGACTRKAPGPEECLGFALDWYGVTDRRMLRSPEVADRIEELTRVCITTPFDRKLLRCVEEKGRRGHQSCLGDFRARPGSPETPGAPGEHEVPR